MSRYYIPFDNSDLLGGPYTFMRNLKAYLDEVNFGYIAEPYLSDGIFFPISFDKKFLDFYKKINGPIIQRLDGVFYPSQHGADYVLKNKMIKEIYDKYATYVIFQSNYSRDQCFAMLGEIEEAKYRIIHNGVNKKVFYPNLRKEARVNKFKFINTGSYRKKIMLSPILDALDLLVGEIDFEFIIVGNITDTSIYPLIKRDYIKFMGPKSSIEVSDLLRDSHAFIHCQINDNCPNAILEAVSTGLPIVGFQTGAIPELCQFNRQLLVEMEPSLFHTEEQLNSKLLADKILYMVENYEYFRSISLKHSSLYDFNDCGNAYLQVMKLEMNSNEIFETPMRYKILGQTKSMIKEILSRF